MKELSFYRVPPILTDFSENESERHQPLEDSKEAAEVGELLDAAPNDQSSVWSDHRFHNPDDPAKLTGSGIVQRASQGPGKLEIWLHVVLILCILLTSIILGTFSAIYVSYSYRAEQRRLLPPPARVSSLSSHLNLRRHHVRPPFLT